MPGHRAALASSKLVITQVGGIFTLTAPKYQTTSATQSPALRSLNRRASPTSRVGRLRHEARNLPSLPQRTPTFHAKSDCGHMSQRGARIISLSEVAGLVLVVQISLRRRIKNTASWRLVSIVPDLDDMMTAPTEIRTSLLELGVPLHNLVGQPHKDIQQRICLLVSYMANA